VTDETARRALREHMRSRRNSLAPRARLSAAEGLAHQLRQLPAMQGATHVAGYWAVRGELPLHALLAPRPHFTYCLPCVVADTALRFGPWHSGLALKPNRYGIPEPDLAPEALLHPSIIDVVLLPLLGFDRRGTRLGSGAGYYDRSFAFLGEHARPSRPLLVGVGYAFQEVEHLPDATWDVPLDYVATEAELIECRSGAVASSH
jgi:5-formyltetrahydrofolate cyclo-ligase